MLRSLTAFLAAAGMVILWAPEAVPQDPATAADGDAADLLKQAQATLRILNRVSESLPREPLEPSDLVERVGKEPEQLTTWVADSIGWLPYQGALRGPRGVLIERRANSLDRSLLLAEALQHAGHEVRLAHATLEADIATKLYAVVRPLRAVEDDHAQRDGSDATRMPDFERYADVFGADPDRLRKAYEALELESQKYLEYVLPVTIRQVADLKRILGEKNSPPPEGAGDLAAAGIQALRDHWWVQIADADGSWTDLDALSLGAGVALDAAPDLTCSLDELPEEARHTLTLRVVAERLGPAGRETAVALSHRVNAAKLAGGHFKLSFGPLNRIDARPPTAGELDSGAYTLRTSTAETEWLPVLTQVDYRGFGEHKHEASILTDGTLNKSPELDAKNRRVKRAADALRGTDRATAAASNSHLTAVWIEYEIDGPGVSSRTIRRHVFDLLGEARRQGEESPAFEFDDGMARTRGLALSGRTQILPTTGRLSTEFLVRLDLATKLENQRLVVQLAQAKLDGDDSKVEGLIRAFATPPLELFMLASMRLSVGRFVERVHIGSVNVFASHSQPLEATPQEAKSSGSVLAYGRSIDVVANAVDVLAPRVGAQAPTLAWDVRLEQGVLDTVLENLALMGPDPASTASVVDDRSLAANTAMWMGRSPAHEWRALAPGDELDAGANDSLARAQSALSTDHVAVLPTALLTEPASNEWKPGCWWRVNRATGETLGVGPRGWGQTMVERAAIARTSMAIIDPIKVSNAQKVCFFAAVAARLLVSYAVGAVGGWTGGSDLIKLAMTMISQAGYSGMIYATVNAACQVVLL